mmetsp:Transcript_10401/g.63474  ORF Transcript_10401/g.63474 Transcript_10401/m.63474 type:complete len:289 (+) Transcript_10401:8332-9198(+)
MIRKVAEFRCISSPAVRCLKGNRPRNRDSIANSPNRSRLKFNLLKRKGIQKVISHGLHRRIIKHQRAGKFRAHLAFHRVAHLHCTQRIQARRHQGLLHTHIRTQDPAHRFLNLGHKVGQLLLPRKPRHPRGGRGRRAQTHLRHAQRRRQHLARTIHHKPTFLRKLQKQARNRRRRTLHVAKESIPDKRNRRKLAAPTQTGTNATARLHHHPAKGTETLVRRQNAHARALHAKGRAGILGGHAAPRPSTPLNAHRNTAAQTLGVGPSVQCGVGRAVVRLTRGTQKGSHR